MEGLEGCVRSLDFLQQEPLRASSQRKAWAELCGTQDMTHMHTQLFLPFNPPQYLVRTKDIISPLIEWETSPGSDVFYDIELWCHTVWVAETLS